MNQYVKRTQRDDSLSFTLAVVEQVEKGGLTVTRVCRMMGISRQAWYQALQREQRRESQAGCIIERVTACSICSGAVVCWFARQRLITKRRKAITVFTGIPTC